MARVICDETVRLREVFDLPEGDGVAGKEGDRV